MLRLSKEERKQTTQGRDGRKERKKTDNPREGWEDGIGASCFSCQTSAISAGRQRLSEGHHALPGPPDGAGLLLMDPAEVPNQSEWR